MANTEEFEVNNETLMNCVQQYRVIYDKRCKDYKVPLKKRNAWKEISEKLGIGGALSSISLATERAPPLSNSLHTIYLVSMFCIIVLISFID